MLQIDPNEYVDWHFPFISNRNLPIANLFSSSCLFQLETVLFQISTVPLDKEVKWPHFKAMASIRDTSTHCSANGSSSLEDVETWYGYVCRIVKLNNKFFITSSERFPIDAAHIPNR